LEKRTFVEFNDILGVEFTCPKCDARVFYPLAKQYDRLTSQCPNCHESWFEQGFNPNTPPVVSQVKDVMLQLQNVAKSPLVKAKIRLQVIENDEDKIERA